MFRRPQVPRSPQVVAWVVRLRVVTQDRLQVPVVLQVDPVQDSLMARSSSQARYPISRVSFRLALRHLRLPARPIHSIHGPLRLRPILWSQRLPVLLPRTPLVTPV